MVFLRQGANVDTFNSDIRHELPMIFDSDGTMMIHEIIHILRILVVSHLHNIGQKR